MLFFRRVASEFAIFSVSTEPLSVEESERDGSESQSASPKKAKGKRPGNEPKKKVETPNES